MMPRLIGEIGSADINVDVIEHIVMEQKLFSAARNIKARLRPNGLLFIIPFADKRARHMFHQADWSMEDMRRIFIEQLGFQLVESAAWLDSYRQYVVLRNSV
ncbi:hypothetical protein WDW86_08940 [Bdellovibrionota bacterium FG-2]